MTYKNKTITKHQRGNWYARIRYNGKVISIYGRTQLEAYAKLKAVVDKIEVEKACKRVERLENFGANCVGIANGSSPARNSITTVAKKDYTLIEWFDEWLNSYKVGTVRAATIESFKRTIPNLQHLHGLHLNEITNLMLAKAIGEVVANRLKDKVHNLVKQMFSCAFNSRLIETNPALSLKRPKQYAKFQKKAFTPEQEKQFIEICLADLKNYEPFLICILQGVRKGEMLALRPNDFDFEQNTLRIDESYDCNNIDDLLTKNTASNRTMPMFSLTREILLKHRDRDPNERIYANFNTANLGYRLKKLLKQGDLPKMTVHELRHTFITRCHEKSIDEIVVQKWVGHAIGSAMTKAVYTHIGDEAERKYIETMNGKTTA